MERMEYCQPHNTYHDYSIPCPYCAAEYDNRQPFTESFQTEQETARLNVLELLQHANHGHTDKELAQMRDYIWTLEHR